MLVQWLPNRVRRPHGPKLTAYATAFTDGWGPDHCHLKILTTTDDGNSARVFTDVLITAEPSCLAVSDCANSLALGAKRRPTIDLMLMEQRFEERMEAGGHMEGSSILCLSWKENVLASGSDDKTLKLWDVGTLTCNASFQPHTGEVTSAAWRLHDANCILTGSTDSSVMLTDIRTPGTGSQWNVTGPVHCLAWNPHSPNSFVVSSHDGLLCALDVRMKRWDCTLFAIRAHKSAVRSVCYNYGAPKLLATCCAREMKVWDVIDLFDYTPKLVGVGDTPTGDVSTVSFCRHNPYVLVMGCTVGVMEWDIHSNTDWARRVGPL